MVVLAPDIWHIFGLTGAKRPFGAGGDAPGKEQPKAGDTARLSRASRVGQIKAPLDPLDPDVHPIKPVRHGSVLVLEIAGTLQYLAGIVADMIDRATDVSQMLKDDVVRLGHPQIIS